MTNRIKTLADTATLKQLYVTLFGDTVISLLAGFLGLRFHIHHHLGFALMFFTVALLEGIGTGITLFLILRRYAITIRHRHYLHN